MIKGSALPLEKGLNKLTAATDIKANITHCDVDGTLTCTWPDGSTSTEEFLAGEDRDTTGVASMTIVAGTFSFARNLI